MSTCIAVHTNTNIVDKAFTLILFPFCSFSRTVFLNMRVATQKWVGTYVSAHILKVHVDYSTQVSALIPNTGIGFGASPVQT